MNFFNILKSRIFRVIGLCLMLSVTTVAAAQSTYPATADATIRKVFDELFINLDQLLATYDQSQSAYYAKVDEVISPWIDYESIARGVMGRTHYTAASEDQRQRFTKAFKQSLVETYGKSLLGVENPDYELEAPESEDGSSAQVKQTLVSATGRVVVIYAMGKSADGRWQVKNVILEGINLGRTFRNQFARSAQEYNDDLDKVISSWSSES